MSDGSQLESVLHQKSTEGIFHSTGEFTLSELDHLKKAGAYTLPFAGAWAVKVIQAAVGSGFCGSIQIVQDRREARFTWFKVESWSAQVIAEALSQAHVEGDGLPHLVTALRGLIFQEERCFRLRVGEQWLIFDGERITFERSHLKDDKVELRVEHLTYGEKSQLWITRIGSASRRRVELQEALSDRCFVCPFSLLLDNQRLDALQFAPRHRWSLRRSLVDVSFVREGSLPQWQPPLGTFQSLNKGEKKRYSRGRPVSANFHSEPAGEGNVSVGVLVSDHGPVSYKGTPEGTGRASYFYWVEDGAIVGEVEALDRVSLCSLGVFLSASGLKKDLTGLSVVLDDAAEERLRRAGRYALAGVGSKGIWFPKPATLPNEPHPVEPKTRLQLIAQGVFFVGCGIFAPGPAWAGAAFLAMGGGSFYLGCTQLANNGLPHSVAKERMEQKLGAARFLESNIDRLFRAWESEYSKVTSR